MVAARAWWRPRWFDPNGEHDPALGRGQELQEGVCAMRLREATIMPEHGCMTERYLSTTEIAALWNVSRPAAAKAFKDVEPDALIGEVRGWKLETIDAVRKSRPGKGNWGPRKSES